MEEMRDKVTIPMLEELRESHEKLQNVSTNLTENLT